MSKDPSSFVEAVSIATHEEMVEKLMDKPKYHISAVDIEIEELRNTTNQLEAKIDQAQGNEQAIENRRERMMELQTNTICNIINQNQKLASSPSVKDNAVSLPKFQTDLPTEKQSNLY